MKFHLRHFQPARTITEARELYRKALQLYTTMPKGIAPMHQMQAWATADLHDSQLIPYDCFPHLNCWGSLDESVFARQFQSA